MNGRKSLFIILACLFITGTIIGASPLSDYLTTKNANPTMLKLAQDAGMTRKGELVFLRTNPQLISDTEMARDCNSSANNNSGFVEQGCFIPNQTDPSTGHIFLREMPPTFYSMEVAAAAYEMLHPVYASIAKQSTASASSLNSAIEYNYSHINDLDITQRVDLFAKTEPGAKDDELFSMLGTEAYDNISTDLQAYYSPYLSNPDIEVGDNQQVKDLFQSDKTQLAQLQTTINTDANSANIAYANSVSWANVGNQYENDRNYAIYSQDIDAENVAITQYNSLLQIYQTLVAQFNGQQFSQIPNVQSQSN